MLHTMALTLPGGWQPFDQQFLYALICSGLDETERQKHAVWHHHPENWQQVERVEYFTKYVGKASALTGETCSTGRWWGFWRKDAVPWAGELRTVLDERVAVDLNRVARKILKKRADAAKQFALAAKLKLNFSPFHPFATHPQPVTLWDLERLRAGHSPSAKGRPLAALWLGILAEVQQPAGVRFGKYRFKAKPGAPDPDQGCHGTGAVAPSGGGFPGVGIPDTGKWGGV